MKKRELTFIITALILGAVIGSLIGDIIGTYLPPGAAKTVFKTQVKVGFDTVRVDFFAISFTVGLMFRINFMAGLMVLLVIFYFRYWYL
jgi:hypothetical protein